MNQLLAEAICHFCVGFSLSGSGVEPLDPDLFELQRRDIVSGDIHPGFYR